MKKILFTGAGGSSVSYLANKLRKKYKIILSDADPFCAGLNSKYESKIIPFGTDEKFEKTLEKIISNENIDYVIPGVDEELLKFWKIKQKNNNFELILPSADFTELCLNKKKLMEELKEKKISYIPTYSIKNSEFPLIAKPIYGRGSRKVHKIENEKELKGYFDLYKLNPQETLLQKYINGREYTVSVIVNNKNKKIGIIPKKIIMKRGITRIAVSKYNKKIGDTCNKIIEKFNPKGPFNVQLKFFEDTPYIFEINPRLSTTSVLTDKVFGNEIDLFIENFNKEKINLKKKMKEGIFMARYEKEVFYRK